nr:hypothetical protein [Tanacetum cinerariifolium]
MEDDDEFGDLYSDVLQPLQMTSSSPSQPPPSLPDSRPIDLNDQIPSDDEEILYGSNKLNLNINLNKLDQNNKVTSSVPDNSETRVSNISKFEKDEILEEENFGIEEGDNDEFTIPGLSNLGARGSGGEWEDDEDSDSEDDLQIVLNDDNAGVGMMGMGGMDGMEEDEDGDNLVIVTGDGDAQMDEVGDWGEGQGEGGEERKEGAGSEAVGPGRGDGTGAVGGGGMKIAFGYHPFHSQFKYVRPGAAPMPGAGPVPTGGAPGQIRPPGNMLPFAGRGRGDWRPAGIKSGPPMQKNFQGYGMQGWGNGAGRGFGSGLDFTLPSHKTIFEVDIDGFDEKPWRLQGIDMSDFFNFGMNEESWKDYCKHLEQHRLEGTMQSKIRVYESGRTEQEYDPDLPPELAAAAGHDIPSDNRNTGIIDVQNDLAKGSARARMQLPTGKAIQVETGFGERLPSIDTRPPRMRDSDAIIEIVLQRSPEEESVPGNDGDEHLEDAPSKENHREGLEIEDDIGSEDDHFDKSQAYNGRKREVSGRRAPVIGSVLHVAATGDRVSHFSETEAEGHTDSRDRTSSYRGKKHNSPRNHVERPLKRTAAERSPRLTDSGTQQDKKFVDNQIEESAESVGRKHSPSSSPRALGSAEDRSFDQTDAANDGLVDIDGNSGMDREDDDTFNDEKRRRTSKKPKLIARAEHASVERGEDREDSKAGRSSENSKARSGSSRDQQNMRDSMEQEVVQAGGSMRSGNFRRPTNEDERAVRSRGRDEKLDRERHQMAMKGMEDPYSHRKWDPNQGYRSHVKSENFDRKKGRDSEVLWSEEMRKRSHDEEMMSRQRHKVRENERIDKNEHRSRKAIENGGWKGDYDRDMIPQQKREGMHSKRLIEDVHVRRADRSEREEALHAHRESTSRRKRERDDNLELHKRDEQARLREDDQHSFRYKEEARLQRDKVERQRERDEWKERDGHRGAGSGRAVEDKAWVGHSRMKEDYRSLEKEYQFKEPGREQLSRKDRVENESVSRHRGREDAYAHGNKLNNEERISRHERGYNGSDRNVSVKDMHAPQEKKHKESLRKGKETDVSTHNSLPTSRRNREDHGSQRSERASSRGAVEQRNSEQNTVTRRSSKRHKENNTSEDEQEDSRKGRSKLERWTSHKEKDFSLGIKASASVDIKETDRYQDNGEPTKPQEIVESSKPLVEDMKIDEPKPAEDKHLDTFEKLKKRSERFKLPMPSGKEILTIKKVENEPTPLVQPEPLPDSEVKPERPARKRRWTSG